MHSDVYDLGGPCDSDTESDEGAILSVWHLSAEPGLA